MSQIKPFGMWTFKIEYEHFQISDSSRNDQRHFPKYRPFLFNLLNVFLQAEEYDL